jgi:transcriptional antiterminator RfaH
LLDDLISIGFRTCSARSSDEQWLELKSRVDRDFCHIGVARVHGSSASRTALLEPGSRLTNGQRWYLAHTLPNQEGRAQAALELQGFGNFLPRRIKTVRHARRLRTVNAPVFPRYIFVALDLDQDPWRSVNGTRGVSSLIMAHERPVPVPVGVVETLIRSSDRSGQLRFENFEIGQTVRLVAGPFAQSLGVVARLSSKERVDVLLNIMSGAIRVSIAREGIEPAA